MYKELRNMIVQKLHAYLDKPVVMVTSPQNKPTYPFIGYTITSYALDSFGRPIYEYGDDYKAKLSQETVFSFTAYSRDDAEAKDLAMDARDFFHHTGRQALRDENLVVAGMTGLASRDSLIVDDCERRAGFDVTIRTTRELVEDVGLIETWNFNEGGTT